MKNLFNVENPVWVFMGKLVDMVILSGLWLICSLPVVTIGASTAALYYVTLKLADNDEGYTVRSFFRAFKENLMPGIPMGIGAVAAGIFLACDMYVYCHMEGQLGVVLMWSAIILTFIYAMVLVYLFPLIARCRTDWKHLLAMAFVMSIKNFGWTLLMIVSAVCLFAIGLFVCAPVLVIAIGGTAYIHSKILNFVWKDYNLGIA